MVKVIGDQIKQQFSELQAEVTAAPDADREVQDDLHPEASHKHKHDHHVSGKEKGGGQKHHKAEHKKKGGYL